MAQSTADTKLYQRVATTISEAIASGKYLPGQRLPSERDLAEEFSVSRPTLREALIALEIRGLVASRHGSGLYVTQADARSNGPELDIGPFELIEARALIEGEAAALAATTISDAQLEVLDRLLVRMVQDNEGDLKEEEADREFHVAIAKATQNVAILAAVEMLWDLRNKSPLCRHMLEKARSRGLKPRIDEHQRIVDSIKARDPGRARNAMRDHLARVVEDLLASTEIEAVEKARTEIDAKRKEYARRRAL